VIIPAGSDAPVESVAPLLGIYAAVTRQAPSGEPRGGWSPEERLTRSEALRGFTSWAAFASGTEADLGTLEVGKRADLVVLDHDLLQIPAAEILATHVRLTAVDGVAVYDATTGASGH
jgi:predicted amidohydrolase YtcJ